MAMTNAGVNVSSDEAVYEVTGVRPTELVEALAGSSVDLGTLVQIGDDIVFSAPRAEREETAAALDSLGATWSERARLAKIAVTGQNTPHRVLALLDAARIDSQFVSASPDAITLFVGQAEADRAQEALAEALEPARA